MRDVEKKRAKAYRKLEKKTGSSVEEKGKDKMNDKETKTANKTLWILLANL